ncbi:helix-turn-helix domain-containing protein [Adlercreutzia sp. ZJ242]|uniref:helix-turn-helix domain-containing protein n=1 Tax=Adlercreutzia sp. ZJ242 TaxID=2709409 RepID=UPI0013ECA183|nr:helix-turn-helix domain-containing protein [Adlercreutzia sp. ZJ242]
MDGSTATIPAATLTDMQGNTIKLDKAAYESVVAFLHALGLSSESGEEAADMRLTTGQAAAILGTSPRTVARLIDSGRLPGSRLGTGYRSVMLSDLMAFDNESKAVRHAHLEDARVAADKAGMYGEEYSGSLSAYLDGLS